VSSLILLRVHNLTIKFERYSKVQYAKTIIVERKLQKANTKDKLIAKLVTFFKVKLSYE
jgi:hypothetical protein